MFWKEAVDMTQPHIDIPREKVADFCRRHHILSLSLFGSVLGDDFRPDSDVDILVDFDPEHIPGLAFFEMELELGEILGRKVDLVTRQCVEQGRNWIRRRHILEHCQRVL
jgi:predicted nucleotidyltransferase